MFNKQHLTQMQHKRFDKWNIILFFLITIIIVGFVVFYYTVQNVCAEEIIESCTPTMPIPTATDMPQVTDTPEPTITADPAVTPTDIQLTPTLTPTTIEATPTAGASASMPTSAPDTGRGK